MSSRKAIVRGKQPDTKALKKANQLQEVEISPEEKTVVIFKAGVEAAIESAPFIGKLVSIANKVSDALDKKKLEKLLTIFGNKLDNQEQFSQAMSNLVSSNYGLTLFQKIVHILRKDYDGKFIELLANVLKNICKEEFERMFDQHHYALSQIEKLSSQALLVLSKYDNWKENRLERATRTSGAAICGDWDKQVSTYLSSQLKIDDANAKRRMAHAFWELDSNGVTTYAEAKVDLTEIGREIYSQIT